jgi:hypothetical protein
MGEEDEAIPPKRVKPAPNQCHCGLQLITPKAYELHLKIHEAKVEFPWPCYDAKCQRSFKSSKAVWQHHKKEHLEMPLFSCSYPPCAYKCQEEDYLKKHIEDNHSVESNGYKSDIRCQSCDKSFATARGRDLHIELCKKPKTFKCNWESAGVKCKKSYKYAASLEFHMQVSHSLVLSLHSCPICKRKYEWESSLTWHMNKKHPDKDAPGKDAPGPSGV